LLWLLSICLPLQALAAPGFTLEQIRNFPFPEALVAAERGSRVAWVENDRGRRNVWVASGPQFTPRQLTPYAEDDGQEITSLAISPDGNSVVYVRGGEHGANWDGGLPANPTSNPAGTKVEIWYVPFAGGVPARIAEGDWPVIAPDGRRIAFIKDGAAWVASISAEPDPKRLFTIRGTTQSPTWSPDGDRLAFVSSRGSHSLVGIYTDERTPIQWLAPSFSRDVSPRWSADGKSVAYVRLPGRGGPPRPMLDFPPQPWAIWVADAASGAGREVWRSGPTLRDSYDGGPFEWAADDRIVFRSYHDGWQHLYSVSRSGGAPVALTPGEYMVEEVFLSTDRKLLFFSANHGDGAQDKDRRHLFRVGTAGGAVRQLTSGDGLEWSPVVTGDGHLVFTGSTAQRPPLVSVQPLNGGRARTLKPESIPADHPAAQLVSPKSVSFTADDGTIAYGQLFEPKGGGKHPAVVYVHGGPRRQMLLGWHPMEYYSNDYAVNQYLVSRGYAVLSVNYRLGVGYGHAFQLPPRAGRRGGSEYKDIQAAGRFLQSLPNVDADRIGIYGGSYGGYLTAMALANDSDLFKVGVDIHGVHNWVTHLNFEEMLARSRFDLPTDADQAVEAAWRASPVSTIAGWRSPVLLIHGDDDRNVAVSETVDLVQRLQQQEGVEFETLNLPDETHGILRYSNVLKMNAATVEFLERYLRPRR